MVSGADQARGPFHAQMTAARAQGRATIASGGSYAGLSGNAAAARLYGTRDLHALLGGSCGGPGATSGTGGGAVAIVVGGVFEGDGTVSAVGNSGGDGSGGSGGAVLVEATSTSFTGVIRVFGGGGSSSLVDIHTAGVVGGAGRVRINTAEPLDEVARAAIRVEPLPTGRNHLSFGVVTPAGETPTPHPELVVLGDDASESVGFVASQVSFTGQSLAATITTAWVPGPTFFGGNGAQNGLVAVSGEDVFWGVPEDDRCGDRAGVLLRFNGRADTLAPIEAICSPLGTRNIRFGFDVAVSGDLLVVGAVGRGVAYRVRGAETVPVAILIDGGTAFGGPTAAVLDPFGDDDIAIVAAKQAFGNRGGFVRFAISR